MIHLIELAGTPIFEQLQLEEALLRAEDRNFCMINHGSSKAIVMGISGDPKSLLHLDLVKRDNIPVIRRFSGGGTVIVDEETLFITFIFAKNTNHVLPFPEPILRWSARVYQNAWKIPGFALLENDYIIHDKKCGGNAQYIQKERWLHHTSFLWNFKQENMAYLQLPAKRPKYRGNRSHDEFLCTLKEKGSVLDLVKQLKTELAKQFQVIDFDPKELTILPHRQSVEIISLHSQESLLRHPQD